MERILQKYVWSIILSLNCEGDVHGEDACPAVMPENKIYPVRVLKTETFTKSKSLFLLPEWLRYDKILMVMFAYASIDFHQLVFLVN